MKRNMPVFYFFFFSPPSCGLSLCVVYMSLFPKSFPPPSPPCFLSNEQSSAEILAAFFSFLLLPQPKMERSLSGRREKQKAVYLVFTLIICRTEGQPVNTPGHVGL